MRAEVLSTARPSGLRLAGFLCLAAGALAAGAGAARSWAAVGFPGDELGTADVPWHGTDVWEGKVVLFAAVVALLATLWIRLSASDANRRSLAAFLVVLGLAAAALPLVDAARAPERFGGPAGIDRWVAWTSAEVGLPERVVREQLVDLVAQGTRVDLEPGIWMSSAGGLLLVAGGVLSLAWVRRRGAGPPERSDASAPGSA
jgi:hypothetical protein